MSSKILFLMAKSHSNIWMLCNLFNLFSLSGIGVGCLFFTHLNDTMINMLLHKFLYVFR